MWFPGSCGSVLVNRSLVKISFTILFFSPVSIQLGCLLQLINIFLSLLLTNQDRFVVGAGRSSEGYWSHCSEIH